MSLKFKSIFVLLFVTVLFNQCKSDHETSNKDVNVFSEISGQTMGTIYNITYQSKKNLKPEIDRILVEINNGVSTYIPSSTISILNNDTLGIIEKDTIVYNLPKNEHFINNYLSSKEVFNVSYNYFDPTIMPLVNYWGFGYTGKRPIEEADSLKILKLRATVGFEKWKMDLSNGGLNIRKPKHSKLDFSAIAKGYAVDYIASFLDKKGIDNYMVEIGGELMTMGKNAKALPWTIGLSKPKVNAGFRDFQTLVTLSGLGMASSGNYRNYYNVGDKTYGHEINPKTGYPEINRLLGTSVIAPNCKMADAYATAFMVMGFDKSIYLIEELKDIEACFFFRDDEGKIGTINSSKFKYHLKETSLNVK